MTDLAERILEDLEAGNITGTEIALSNVREAIATLTAAPASVVDGECLKLEDESHLPQAEKHRRFLIRNGFATSSGFPPPPQEPSDVSKWRDAAFTTAANIVTAHFGKDGKACCDDILALRRAKGE